MSTHEIRYEDASGLEALGDSSVALMVTSPPYPMIEMWDEFFVRRSADIRRALEEARVQAAFELMHAELDRVWSAVYRVLMPGGIACINIGDATRTLNGDFQLFSSHARILRYCIGLGFQNLPNIVWRKTTNAPNKFMGSGMLPPGAYVTLEHEHVLVLRKGGKRRFTAESEKQNRRESAFFWEERNTWFSDVWFGLVGVGQELEDDALRSRSAAFPFELAYRLINMFSVKDDVVLDPFLGTGTTMLAAMASERDSVSYEIDPAFDALITADALNLAPRANAYIRGRLQKHVSFVEKRLSEGKKLAHTNVHYGFPCVSSQERFLLLHDVRSVVREGPARYTVDYAAEPQAEFVRDWLETTR